jgi:capsular polysaccharide biosynthesis protein
MTLSGALAVARRWWLMIALAAVVGGAAGYLVAAAASPTYEGEARVLVGPVNGSFDTVRASMELTETYGSIATSGAVLGDTARMLGLPDTVEQLRERVTVRSDVTTRIVTIRAQATDPRVAAGLANGVADSLGRFAVASNERPEGAVSIVDRAVPPADPIAPRVELIALLSALAALVAAILLVAVLELLDDSVRSVEELERVTGLAVLGRLPIARPSVPADALLVDDEWDDIVPAYRGLLGRLPPDEPGARQVIAAVDAEGGLLSRRLVVNLVAAATGSGTSVRLVDARHERLPLEVVTTLQRFAPSVRAPRGGPRVSPLVVDHRPNPDTPVPMDPDPEGTSGALELVDIGDPRESAFAGRWARAVDTVFVVVQLGHTHRAALADVVARFEGSGPRILAVAVEPHGAPGSGSGLAGLAGMRRRLAATSPAGDPVDVEGTG